ncbi:MAG: hypothetical protein H7308_08565 [Chthonomonadaceae bacterium]|nr:hypothetical protein [Chthonomonadaceae bacterium]
MRLRGTGNRNGRGIGTTAIVRTLSGITLPPQMPESLRLQRDQKRFTELPDIVLIAENLTSAVVVAMGLEWGNVVGAAVENELNRDEIALRIPFSVISGVRGLTEFAREDVIALLDSFEGSLTLEPDFGDIARFQAAEENIAPRTRLFIEDAHGIAKTTDGNPIRVYARVETETELAAAVEAGADALFVVPRKNEVDTGFFFADNEEALLDPDAEEKEQRKALSRLATLAGGKPIVLASDYGTSLRGILEVGTEADFTLAVFARDDLPGMGFTELAEALREEQRECEEEDIPTELPKIALRLSFFTANAASKEDLTLLLDKAQETDISQIILETGDTSLPLVADFVSGAATRLLPVVLLLSENELALCIGLQVSGILTLPKEVREAKRQIRTTSQSFAREAMIQALHKATRIEAEEDR